jgi:hypothetical protein
VIEEKEKAMREKLAVCVAVALLAGWCVAASNGAPAGEVLSALKALDTPLFPPSDPARRLPQGPPAKSKLLAAKLTGHGHP